MSKNKWIGIRNELTRLRQIATQIIIEKQPEPPGWDWGEFRHKRNWLERKLNNRRQGHMDAILGGPAQANAFNAVLWDAVKRLQEARQAGAIPVDYDGTEDQSTMILPLVAIYEAPRYDESRLEKIDPVTDDERDNFTSEDWKYYAQGAYDKILLPSLGEPRYFRKTDSPVIPLAGKRYRLTIKTDTYAYDKPSEPTGKFLVLEETEEPETEPDCPAPERNYRGSHYMQVFGQPHWIQGGSYPAASNGEPCRHLCTIENGWGDSGNWNILVSLGPDGLPDIAYFEASCC